MSQRFNSFAAVMSASGLMVLTGWVIQGAAHSARQQSLEQEISWKTSASRLKSKIESIESEAIAEAKREGRPFDLEAAGTDYYRSLHYYIEERALPGDSINWQMYLDGAETMRKLEKTPTYFGDEAPKWEFMGPYNLKPGSRIYNGTANVIGRVSAIAIRETASSRTLYVGSPSGGLWVRNNDTSWESLSDATWDFLSVSSIGLDPTNPQVLYVGTGDYHGARPTGGVGIMRSTDAGATWTQSGQADFGGKAVSAIYVVPENPNIILASTGRGANRVDEGYVWRSTDRGQTWTKALNVLDNWSNVTAGELDTATGRRFMYACGMSGSGVVYRSTNNGATWTKMTIPTVASNNNFLDIEVSKLDPATAYLFSGKDKKIFQTKDTGLSWTDISYDFPGPAPATFGSMWSQLTYNWTFETGVYAPAPNVVKEILFAGAIDIAVHEIGSGNWTSIGKSYTKVANTHNDQQVATISPLSRDRLYFGNDGGLYTFKYPDGERRSNIAGISDTGLVGTTKFCITEFYHASFQSNDANVVQAGCQDNSSPFTTDWSNSWSTSAPTGDGGFSGIGTGAAANNIVAGGFASNNTLWISRTKDKWATAAQTKYIGCTFDAGENPLFIPPLVMDPNDSTVLYTASNRLYKGKLEDGSWAKTVNTQLSAGAAVRFIAIAPNDSNVIYTGSMDGEIYMSTNKGAAFTKINAGTTALPAGRPITGIAVDPTNKHRVLICLSGSNAPASSRVWICEDTSKPDAMRVWTNKSGDIPDVPSNTIAFDPSTPATKWYVGNDLGVYYTVNGGTAYKNGTRPFKLPIVSVRTIAPMAGTDYVNIATYGRGIWRIKKADLN